MANRLPITGLQCIEMLQLATRLTPEEFLERHHWLALVTNPEFDTDNLNELLKFVTYPANGEFNLSILEPFTGLEMVQKSRLYSFLRFIGQEITAPQAKRFKLVTIGSQRNFEAVKTELAKHGAIPQGQWCRVLKKVYPKHSGGPIGVADASWVDLDNRTRFPFVDKNGVECFGWTLLDFPFSDNWRWLVEVQ